MKFFSVDFVSVLFFAAVNSPNSDSVSWNNESKVTFISVFYRPFTLCHLVCHIPCQVCRMECHMQHQHWAWTICEENWPALTESSINLSANIAPWNRIIPNSKLRLAESTSNWMDARIQKILKSKIEITLTLKFNFKSNRPLFMWTAFLIRHF